MACGGRPFGGRFWCILHDRSQLQKQVRLCVITPGCCACAVHVLRLVWRRLMFSTCPPARRRCCVAPLCTALADSCFGTKLTSLAFSLERDEALEGDAIAAAAPDTTVAHGKARAFRDVLSAVVPYTAGGSRH